MKRKFLVIISFILLVASCSPTEKISGAYHGQYTNNVLILSNATATITKVDDKNINLTITEPTISPFTINNISVTVDNANFVLLKVGLVENLSGAVQGNQLTISYTYLGGAVTFVGTR